MQFTTSTLAVLGTVIFSNLTSGESIAYGQQLQDGDQANHWITWQSDKHACHSTQVLQKLIDSPCDKPFFAGKVQYAFSGCTGDAHEPGAILDSGGLQVGTCRPTSHKKIPCHHGEHNIIKRGVCDINT
ncbi:hypothetical protein F4808DRAFT_432491 [Astrocystis sublimbata]|nr:hypothetical protein F4808DRAFT_432491 [Astrocystis sublimbata]